MPPGSTKRLVRVGASMGASPADQAGGARPSGRVDDASSQSVPRRRGRIASPRSKIGPNTPRQQSPQGLGAGWRRPLAAMTSLLRGRGRVKITAWSRRTRAAIRAAAMVWLQETTLGGTVPASRGAARERLHSPGPALFPWWTAAGESVSRRGGVQPCRSQPPSRSQADLARTTMKKAATVCTATSSGVTKVGLRRTRVCGRRWPSRCR